MNIDLILNSLKDRLCDIICKCLDAILHITGFAEHFLDHKEEKDKKKEIKQKEKEIKDICDNGTLENLFDLKKFNKSLILVLSCILFPGCISQNNIEVSTTKQWEGHYFSEKDFYQATRDIQLQKGESIWVLSNKSLNRVLNQELNK